MAFSIINRIHSRGILPPVLMRNLSLTPAYLNDSKDDAANKLNNLLQSIIKDESLAKDSAPKLASTGEKIVPKKKPKKEKPKDLGKQIVEAAEKVAKTVPGKPDENEAQLLHKLLYNTDKSLSENIMKAASGKATLAELLSDMPIERPQKKVVKQKVKDAEISRATKVRDFLGRKEYIPRQPSFVSPERVDLFGETKLGIFQIEDTKTEEGVKFDSWEAMRKRDLKLLVTHPPNNIYDQMIIWTERGILWKYPIDNEYGLEEEHNTDFTEHIFLEQQIDDWCPEQGPIRHFMELVCVGLSKNHWLSAKEKRDHLLWYKDFFTSKKELIKDLGAGEIKTAQTQIE